MARPHGATSSYGPKHSLKTLGTLVPYLWPKDSLELRIRVAIALSLLIAAKATNVGVPLFYKEAVDILTPGTSGAETAIFVPVFLIVGYGLARILAQAFGELRDAVFAKVQQRAKRQAGLRTFQHLHHLSLRFHMDRKTGGISRAVERGTAGIEFLLTFMLFNIVPTLVEIFLVCGMLWYLYGPLYAVITFATLAIYIAWTLIVTEWRIKFRRRMNESDSEANTKAIDSLLNYETVKYFGNEDHEARRYESSLKTYERAAVTSQTSLSLLNIGQGIVIAAGLITLMLMAAHGVTSGKMTVGDFVLVNSYLVQLFIPLNFLGFVYREIRRSLTDMETMFDILDENVEVEDKPGANDLNLQGGRVIFDNVEFAYDERRQVLKGISFAAEPGQTIALVGPTGSGKSTISRLLFRFYDVKSGAISIDGQDIRNISQKSLRAAIGMVPQDTVLFNDSIYYNIAYGRPGATPSEVEQAATLAQVHDFIQSLPDGYQSVVGERGLKLSGGEKQRVAIARAILKQPEIMIFDEATSALDTHTEKEIQRAMDAVSKDRTTLIIAHRLSTVVHADEILVLDGGKLVERGDHQTLMTMEGAYAALWKRQQEAQDAARRLAEAGEALDLETLPQKL